MSAPVSIVEFEGTIDAKGNVTIPHNVVRVLGPLARSRFRVRLTEAGVAGTLKQRLVTDAEVDAIAACQRESRDHVVGFLLSEGALGSRRGRRRRGKGGHR